MVNIRMAPRPLLDDPADSVVLTRLSIATCGPPTRAENSLIWRFPCRLAVAVTLSDAKHPVLKALSAARDQHLFHPRQGHQADGDWAIVVRRRGGHHDARCDHTGAVKVMA